jgi:Zn-dependent peptidase ImmA (M78 family)
VINIEPKILKWARETAGLSVEEAAPSLGFTKTQTRSAADKLLAIESGTESVSRALLSKMSSRYHQPLTVFYLRKPPIAADRGKDFRTILGTAGRLNPNLDALIRDLKARQAIVRSMLEDEQAVPVAFIASAHSQMPVKELAKQITETIGFELKDFRATGDFEHAFRYARGRLESVGVFVLLVGDLGSHHTRIPVEEFRGFALADTLAPLVVINDQDSPAARCFTAFHELVHLFIGETGISGGNTSSLSSIEKYCNEVASQILLPDEDFKKLKLSTVSQIETLSAEIRAFGTSWKVSKDLVAYRLLQAGLIKTSTWQKLIDNFRQEFLMSKEAEKSSKAKQSGGPNYFTTRRHRLGEHLLKLVRRSLDEGTVSYSRAAKALGVKPTNVDPLFVARGNSK